MKVKPRARPIPAPSPEPGKEIEVILIVALAVTPLALVPGLFLSHDVVPKLVLILTGAALALLLLPQWKTGLDVLWADRRGRLFLLLVAAQFVSLSLATVFSTRPALSFAGTVWRRFGWAEQSATLVVASAAACLAAARPPWVATLVRAAVVCGGLATLYGILQYFGVDPFLSRDLYAVEFLGSVARPPSTMGHSIYFSAWLAPIALLAASAALAGTSRGWRRICGAAALLTGLAILLSGSRGGALAVTAGGLLLVWRARSAGLWKPSRRLPIAAAIILALGAVAVFSPAGANLRQRIHQWGDDPGGTRLGVWREAPALVIAHPILGAGPETFSVEFRRIESAALSRAYPDFDLETPHNAFLDAACAQGLPGLLILTALFALVLFPSSTAGMRGAVVQGAVLAALIASLFASLTLVSSMGLWALVGIGVAPEPARPAAPVRAPAYLRAAAMVPAGVFLAVAILQAVADADFARLGSAVGAGNFTAANDAYTAAARVSLGMPGYELWSSREMAALGRSLGDSPDGRSAWRVAAEAAGQAEQRSEEPAAAAYQCSVLAVARGDLTQAESKARDAIGLAPNWYKPHLLLAQILEAMGRSDEAAAQKRISTRLGWRG